jgi:tetratricopeptide (TPR) repeat protein
MRIVALLCGLVFFGTFGFAEEVRVEFIDGFLEVMEESDWVDVETGDMIPPDADIRLDESTIIELTLGETKITISREGIYSLADLLKESRARESSQGFTAFLKNSLRTAVGEERGPATAAVLGVRGADADDRDFEWMEEDEGVLEEGEAYLQDGSYQEAILLFREAEEKADEEVAQRYRFYSAYAYAMLGHKGMALKILRDVEPNPIDSYYGDWVLLKGQLLFESQAFRDALTILSSYTRYFPDGSLAQKVHLFSGLSNHGLGDNAAAQKSFEMAYEIDRNSDAGKLAAGYLADQR